VLRVTCYVLRVMTNPILIITGPTGVGKTSCAIDVLSEINGAIISADSRQVYKGVDYVTNKISPHEDYSHIKRNDGKWIQHGVPIYGYDSVWPDGDYHVARFVDDAKAWISKLWHERLLPVVVGGTGYYVDALLGVSPYSSVAPNPETRKRLFSYDVETLYEMIRKKDSAFFAKIHDSEKNNKLRLVRYLEIIETTGSIASSQIIETILQDNVDVFEVVILGSYDELYQRSDRWVDELIATGHLTKETTWLIDNYPHSRLLLGLLFNTQRNYLTQSLTLEEREQRLKWQLHNYIRRQVHWLRRRPHLRVYSISDVVSGKVVKDITKWYDCLVWQP